LSIINRTKIILVQSMMYILQWFSPIVPSKEDLDGNLKNHMEDTKYAKIVEDVSRKEHFTLLLLIGQKIMLSRSSKSIPKNRGNHYEWNWNQTILWTLMYHMEVRLILSLVCCIGVIGPKLANMLQKNLWNSLFISKSSSWVCMGCKTSN